MKTTKIKPLAQADVAYLLRRSLGPACAWEDKLADMRRGKATYLGLTLLPCGVTPGRQPLYRREDVRAFIVAALLAGPPHPNPATALTDVAPVEFNPSWPPALWRWQVLQPAV